MNVTSDPTTSPIRFLYRHVVPAMYNVAPEKKDLIQHRLSQLDLVISNSHEFLCEAMPGLGVVRIRTPNRTKIAASAA